MVTFRKPHVKELRHLDVRRERPLVKLGSFHLNTCPAQAAASMGEVGYFAYWVHIEALSWQGLSHLARIAAGLNHPCINYIGFQTSCLAS